MDITTIDTKIHQYFENERGKTDMYRDKIEELTRILSTTTIDAQMRARLTDTLTQYASRVDNIHLDEDYGFYISETCDILEKYKKILKTPIKMSFFGANKNNSSSDEITREKDMLAHEYVQIARKYIPELVIDQLVVQRNSATDCDNCGSKKSIVDNFSHICLDCGCERDNIMSTLSYKDMSRTNVLQKGSYEERSHFRDALNQYQGKQNCKIDRKIFEDLELEFKKHHLLVLSGKTQKERFSKIKKEHIMLFLKELGYDKQYENANYIYSELTGVKCPDICNLEEQLMDDFDTLVNLYTKKFKYEKNIERKSFINIQCVLFQLLLKNKHNCRKEDFNILKTTDRKTFHDEILRELFEELGWNYTPFF